MNFVINHDVFGLDVTMDDVVDMEVFDGKNDRANIILSVIG
jgi:hypothetical protein